MTECVLVRRELHRIPNRRPGRKKTNKNKNNSPSQQQTIHRSKVSHVCNSLSSGVFRPGLPFEVYRFCRRHPQATTRWSDLHVRLRQVPNKSFYSQHFYQRFRPRVLVASYRKDPAMTHQIKENPSVLPSFLSSGTCCIGITKKV